MTKNPLLNVTLVEGFLVFFLLQLSISTRFCMDNNGKQIM